MAPNKSARSAFCARFHVLKKWSGGPDLMGFLPVISSQKGLAKHFVA
jgi:hypothetical protein